MLELDIQETVQWGDKCSMHKNGKGAQELCGTSFDLSKADVAQQSGDIYHFREQDGVNSRRRRSKQKTAQRQMYHATTREGTQNIKLCRAQDQGP